METNTDSRVFLKIKSLGFTRVSYVLGLLAWVQIVIWAIVPIVEIALGCAIIGVIFALIGLFAEWSTSRGKAAGALVLNSSFILCFIALWKIGLSV